MVKPTHPNKRTQSLPHCEMDRSPQHMRDNVLQGKALLSTLQAPGLACRHTCGMLMAACKGPARRSPMRGRA